MRGLLIVLGIVLILVGAGFLVANLAVADNAFVQDLMIDYYCDPDETHITSVTISPNTEESSTLYYCNDSQGNQREITGAIVLTAIASFGLPFLTGILMIFGGSRSIVRGQANSFGMNNIKLTQMPDGSFQRDLSPEQKAMTNNVSTTANMTGMPSSTASSATVAERLQQLDDARKQGLITSGEHQRARQAILDAMDDNI